MVLYSGPIVVTDLVICASNIQFGLIKQAKRAYTCVGFTGHSKFECGSPEQLHRKHRKTHLGP